MVLTERLYRPDEVAKLLRISIPTVYRWAKTGRLVHEHIGPRLIRIPESEVKRLRASIAVSASGGL